MAIEKGKFIPMDYVSCRTCLDSLDGGMVGFIFQPGALGRRSTQCDHTAANYIGAVDSVLSVDQRKIACACKRGEKRVYAVFNIGAGDECPSVARTSSMTHFWMAG